MPRVEDCGVDIAVRDSVADAEERELSVAVRVDFCATAITASRSVSPRFRAISTSARSVSVASLRAASRVT
jgi:hypothetical protein